MLRLPSNMFQPITNHARPNAVPCRSRDFKLRTGAPAAKLFPWALNTTATQTIKPGGEESDGHGAHLPGCWETALLWEPLTPLCCIHRSWTACLMTCLYCLVHNPQPSTAPRCSPRGEPGETLTELARNGDQNGHPVPWLRHQLQCSVKARTAGQTYQCRDRCQFALFCSKSDHVKPFAVSSERDRMTNTSKILGLKNKKVQVQNALCLPSKQQTKTLAYATNWI